MIIALLVLVLLGARPAIAATVSAESELIYESPVFTGDEERYRPKETMEKDGKVYKLVSTRVKAARKEGTLTFASAVIPYSLEAGEEPPETAMITINEDNSGTTFDREVPLLEMKETGSIWVDDFSFSVTVTGYGADAFYLGETEIPGEAELSEIGPELLTYLELPADCYRVDTVEWEGEPYVEEGTLCRNAVAKGAKLVRNVEIKYGGQVRTPEIEGKQYVGIYQELVPETETTEPETTEETNGTDKSEEESVGETENSSGLQMQTGTFKDQIVRWLKQHMTVVTFSGFFFVGIFLAAALFRVTRRKD